MFSTNSFHYLETEFVRQLEEDAPFNCRLVNFVVYKTASVPDTDCGLVATVCFTPMNPVTLQSQDLAMLVDLKFISNANHKLWATEVIVYMSLPNFRHIENYGLWS